MSYGENGGVIGPINTPTSSVASGVWSLGEVAEASRDEIWPQPVYPLTYTGGTTFTYGGATFVKFTSSGTLTLTGGAGLVDYLVVGGGGAGGFNQNYSQGNGGGGGGAGIAYGTNYQLDYSVRTTFAITIAAGAVGQQVDPGNSGGNSKIADWGLANGTSNFDFAGGTSYATTGGTVGAAGGGGGGRGDWTYPNNGATGVFGNQVASASGDWASGGAGGGGGGWDGYQGGFGGYGGNSYINTSATEEGLDLIKSQNPDGSVATHYVVGRQEYFSPSSVSGMQGIQGLGGTAAAPVFPLYRGAAGDVYETNRGFEWLDGTRYGSPGAGGLGNWWNSSDGGGRGLNQGGPLSALANQGGGGAGAGGSGNYGSGGSGIVIIRFQP
jgi:hypothetical protein